MINAADLELLRDVERDVDVPVWFECPPEVEKSKNVRVETFVTERFSNGQLSTSTFVQAAYLQGCKTCQQVRSKCECAEPVISELLVYDRNRGADGKIIRQHFAQLLIKVRPHVSKQDIRLILPTSESYQDLQPGTEEETGIERYEMPEILDGRFIQFLQDILHKTNEPPVYMRFSFPDRDQVIAGLQEFFKKHGRVFPEDAAPVRQGLYGGTTEQYGASATMRFPVPKDLSMLHQTDYTINKTPSNEQVQVSNVRFIFKLLVEYPELCDLNYMKKKPARTEV